MLLLVAPMGFSKAGARCAPYRIVQERNRVLKKKLGFETHDSTRNDFSNRFLGLVISGQKTPEVIERAMNGGSIALGSLSGSTIVFVIHSIDRTYRVGCDGKPHRY